MQRETSVDVVILGAGIMGAATAWQLSRRGRRVALCDQYQFDHVYGSSHGHSRIFRLAYEEPDYVQLAREAEHSWREVEDQLGQRLLVHTGGFDFGSSADLARTVEALESSGCTAELLDEPDVIPRFPNVALPQDWQALFQPDAGVLRAKVALEGFQRLAAAGGTILCPETRALSISPKSDRVDIETDQGVFSAGTVVITSGGWANSLLRPLGLGIPIRVTREHVAYYHVRDDQNFLPFIWHPDDGSPQFYGLPNLQRGIAKVGHHGAGAEVTAGSRGTPDPARVATITEFVKNHFQCLEPRPVLSETCLYASTPDDDFVLDRFDRVVLGVGFGGHGFKFAPAIGSVLADLVEGNPIEFADRFTWQRFDRSEVHAR